MSEPQYPLWAFLTEMAAIPTGLLFYWLLARRIRTVYPATWERLGRPSGAPVFPVPGTVMAALETAWANTKLIIFPFRYQSFELWDWTTGLLMWAVRTIVILIVALRFWSSWVS